jgi:hypothetical protein
MQHLALLSRFSATLEHLHLGLAPRSETRFAAAIPQLGATLAALTRLRNLHISFRSAVTPLVVSRDLFATEWLLPALQTLVLDEGVVIYPHHAHCFPIASYICPQLRTFAGTLTAYEFATFLRNSPLLTIFDGSLISGSMRGAVSVAAAAMRAAPVGTASAADEDAWPTLVATLARGCARQLQTFRESGRIPLPAAVWVALGMHCPLLCSMHAAIPLECTWEAGLALLHRRFPAAENIGMYQSEMGRRLHGTLGDPSFQPGVDANDETEVVLSPSMMELSLGGASELMIRRLIAPSLVSLTIGGAYRSVVCTKTLLCRSPRLAHLTVYTASSPSSRSAPYAPSDLQYLPLTSAAPSGIYTALCSRAESIDVPARPDLDEFDAKWVPIDTADGDDERNRGSQSRLEHLHLGGPCITDGVCAEWIRTTHAGLRSLVLDSPLLTAATLNSLRQHGIPRVHQLMLRLDWSQFDAMEEEGKIRELDTSSCITSLVALMRQHPRISTLCIHGPPALQRQLGMALAQHAELVAVSLQFVTLVATPAVVCPSAPAPVV